MIRALIAGEEHATPRGSDHGADPKPLGPLHGQGDEQHEVAEPYAKQEAPDEQFASDEHDVPLQEFRFTHSGALSG
jgi:hypothetical protein